jgi:hypothetical protein
LLFRHLAIQLSRLVFRLKSNGDEEGEFAHELHEFSRKENWQLVFSGFADKNICRFFD